MIFEKRVMWVVERTHSEAEKSRRNFFFPKCTMECNFFLILLDLFLLFKLPREDPSHLCILYY